MTICCCNVRPYAEGIAALKPYLKSHALLIPVFSLQSLPKTMIASTLAPAQTN